VIIVARGEEKLFETRDEIEARGGKLHAYTCDLADMAAATRWCAKVDWPITAASISWSTTPAARSAAPSRTRYDRFHDFERTMQLNYFGALRLIMGFCRMLTSAAGHIINISSIGVLANAPRFSAYVASKAALDAFSRCAAAEFSDKRHPLHHHQHAAGAHADDRADQDLRQRADAQPRGGRRPGRAGHHPQAGAHRHPARHLLPSQASQAEPRSICRAQSPTPSRATAVPRCGEPMVIRPATRPAPWRAR
jgi:NAD(P)-dependent dehydrogenase (short-subunit alcohol dehydrogenase family)